VTDADRLLFAQEGLELLRRARRALLLAGATKAAERTRLAITSAGGAVRHARLAPYRAGRRKRAAS
jgi:hypothetical protein